MKPGQWFLLLSCQQRIWMFGTLTIIIAIIALGMFAEPGKKTNLPVNISVDMSIRQIAHKLGVTPKSLAREFKLPINISKRKPLHSFGITNKELKYVAQHLLSHHDATVKYFVYVGLVLWGLVFLVKLGRPSKSNIQNRKKWYPRTPYIITLLLAVIIAGFILGKSPNPMGGIVKALKSMVGLYPDPFVKFIVFAFFLALAIVGNKLICGWVKKSKRKNFLLF